MARRVRWTATAEADLADAFVELDAESPQAAGRLLDVIETATAMLLRHPGLGRSCGFRSARAKYVRSWVLGFATRVLYYRGIDDGIEVIRMLHGRRDVRRIVDAEGCSEPRFAGVVD